jgi:hypothetical protein
MKLNSISYTKFRGELFESRAARSVTDEMEFAIGKIRAKESERSDQQIGTLLSVRCRQAADEKYVVRLPC